MICRCRRRRGEPWWGGWAEPDLARAWRWGRVVRNAFVGLNKVESALVISLDEVSWVGSTINVNNIVNDIRIISVNGYDDVLRQTTVMIWSGDDWTSRSDISVCPDKSMS